MTEIDNATLEHLDLMDEAESEAQAALEEIPDPDTPAITEARQRVDEAAAVLAKARGELAQAEQAVVEAKAHYQDAEEARLRGTTNGGAVSDARRVYAEACCLAEVLSELTVKLEADAAGATAELTAAVTEAKRRTARQRWNGLADKQRKACGRLEKGLREVKAALPKIRELAIEQMALAPAAGATADFHRFQRRVLVNYVENALADSLPGLARPHPSIREFLGTEKLVALCPFAKDLNVSKD